jgi:hypothetical protein
MRANLDGYEFVQYSTKTLPYANSHSPHTFYNPISYRDLLFYVWKVDGQELDEYYYTRHRFYFSVYENGRIVQPDKDARFASLHASQFDKRAWVDCHFRNLKEIVSFIYRATL